MVPRLQLPLSDVEQRKLYFMELSQTEMFLEWRMRTCHPGDWLIFGRQICTIFNASNFYPAHEI